jgi:hypothetical protein
MKSTFCALTFISKQGYTFLGNLVVGAKEVCSLTGDGIKGTINKLSNFELFCVQYRHYISVFIIEANNINTIKD